MVSRKCDTADESKSVMMILSISLKKMCINEKSQTRLMSHTLLSFYKILSKQIIGNEYFLNIKLKRIHSFKNFTTRYYVFLRITNDTIMR